MTPTDSGREARVIESVNELANTAQTKLWERDAKNGRWLTATPATIIAAFFSDGKLREEVLSAFWSPEKVAAINEREKELWQAIGEPALTKCSEAAETELERVRPLLASAGRLIRAYVAGENVDDLMHGWLDDNRSWPREVARPPRVAKAEASQSPLTPERHCPSCYALSQAFVLTADGERCPDPWHNPPAPPAPTEAKLPGVAAEYDPLELAHERILAFAPNELGSDDALRDIAGLLCDAIRERAEPPSSVGFVTRAELVEALRDYATAANMPELAFLGELLERGGREQA
ncbi:hypothetical protein [Caudoviricetes sp.]|nr:hypothetical protein [Caudoviricetes sp.]